MLSGSKALVAVVGLLVVATAAQASPAFVAPNPGQALPLVAALGFLVARRRSS